MFRPDAGSQFVNILSMLLLVTTLAIVSQRRLSACVDLFALQSLFLGLTAALVAYLTGIRHIYIAALLTIFIKALVIPIILKRVIEHLNVKRELVFNINTPTSLLICGALVIFAFSLTQPIISLGFLLTKDSLAVALAIILIGFYTMISRKKAVSQVIGFLVIENGIFLGAIAAAYGMPLIVELGILFDVLVASIITGIFTNRIQDAFDTIDISQFRGKKE
jgi:hydrogenase-4 component E